MAVFDSRAAIPNGVLVLPTIVPMFGHPGQEVTTLLCYWWYSLLTGNGGSVDVWECTELKDPRIGIE